MEEDLKKDIDVNDNEILLAVALKSVATTVSSKLLNEYKINEHTIKTKHKKAQMTFLIQKNLHYLMLHCEETLALAGGTHVSMWSSRYGLLLIHS